MKGGEIVSKILSIEGVKNVFGIIDGTYLGLYSTLSKHGINFVSPRNEMCGLNMAGKTKYNL